MRNLILASSLASLLALTSCATNTAVTIETDANTALTDSLALLNVLETGGKINAGDAAIATQVISGLQALLGVVTANASEGTEAQILASTQVSVDQIATDMPGNAIVQKAAAAAKTALSVLTATQTASAKVQAETALGVLALDYLAAQQGTMSEAHR